MEKSLSNPTIIDFKAEARERNRPLAVNVANLCGDDLGHYMANLKSDIMIFIYTKVQNLSVCEQTEKLGISEDDLRHLKGLQVSQFSLDEVFQMSYRLGYTFEMTTHEISKPDNTLPFKGAEE